MSPNLAERQLQIISWEKLQPGGEEGSKLAEDLRTMLFTEGKAAGDAYLRLENPVVAQGNLFECAPAVVSVIIAAVSDASIPEKNLAMVLDLLGRIVGGAADSSEVEAGRGDLQERCQQEASKGYWSLLKIAAAHDPYGAHEVATDVLELIDQPHSHLFLDD